MQKWLQEILLFIAVATIIGHSSLPHQHHVKIATVAHPDEEQGTDKHHNDNSEDKDEEHSIFSFAQLDENFVHVKFQDVSIVLPIVYLLTSVITYHHNLVGENSKTDFCYYQEYPPPCSNPSDYNRRGPPSLSA